PTVFDRAVWVHPATVRAITGLVVASTILLWAGRTDRILARLIGLAGVALFATGLWSLIRTRPRSRPAIGFAVVGLIAAAALVAAPVDSEILLSQLVGAALLAVAVRDTVRTVRTRSGADEPDHREARAWILLRSAAIAAAAAVLLLFPAEVFSALISLIALAWIAVSILVIIAVIDTGGQTREVAASRLVTEWLADRPKSVDDRRSLYAKILYEGPRTRLRVIRFFTLMGFASVIASMGVVTDSTAVVIGAMLIAPLMSPLMGIAISLVMGWPRRLARSAIIATAGIAFAISIGVVIGLIVPTVIDTATNTQILGRSTPTMLDLITALAAGAAGAYGLSRPDVSDSLPGVAIAISLVPPLTVVGIAYSQADWRAGNGALLLFLTNMLAIMVMGGLTFIATGVTPAIHAAENQSRVRTAMAGVAVLGAIVIGALLLNGAQLATDAFEQSSVEEEVETWLEDHPDHALVRWDRTEETFAVVVIGPTEDAPEAQALASALATRLEEAVTVDLRLVVQERSIASSE
ncbi:MAG: DUF389 domain-containing protein, partial [Actinomycetota bacterium]